MRRGEQNRVGAYPAGAAPFLLKMIGWFGVKGHVS